MKTINVVAAIIRDDNKIFSTARGYGRFKGKWEFPGGKIESGETSQEALKREIREELNIDTIVGDLLDVIDYDYPEFHLHMECYWASIKFGNIELVEASDSSWLTREQLDSVNWLPADQLIVDKIKRQL